METIKTIVNQFYPLLIMVAAFTFVVWIFFSAPLNGEQGVFSGTGEIYTEMMDEGELKDNGLSYMEGLYSPLVPVLTYINGPVTVGESYPFKEQFRVTKEDGTSVNGKEEDEFILYLTRIENQDKENVLVSLTTDEIAGLGEIKPDFVYDKEQDILYFYAPGLYTVTVKVCVESGAQKTYTFPLLVDDR